MNVLRTPTTLDKLTLAGDTTVFEPAGDTPAVETRRKPSPADLPCISEVATPRGPKAVMKTMMTTACERNCFYCPFRAGRGKTQRVTFKPDEMAAAFDGLQHRGAVDGLFLSSGIINGSVTTQDKILDTVEIVRKRYNYRGYIHLKIMPGAEYDQLRRAMQLADRISINLEGPTDARLHALAPKKDFTNELLQRLAWAHQLRAEGLRASSVTQFVVGAVGETDLELLSLTEKLHRQMSLTRAYYSAFHPVTDTPFENLNPTLPTRELRLYQASFLLRDYGWNVEELQYEGEGNLRLDLDPKRAWAETQLRHQPIDLMRADGQQLMRVPGIGPKGAAAILRARRTTRLTDLSQLRALGIRAPEQSAPYILLDGGRPPEQLRLF